MNMKAIEKLLEEKLSDLKENFINDIAKILEESNCIDKKDEVLEKLQVYELREKGIYGKGIKVAVIDYDFLEIPSELEFAEFNGFKSKNVGHGLFTSSLIKSKLLGVAPECELYVYSCSNSYAIGNQVEKIKEYTLFLKDCLNKNIDVISIALGMNFHEIEKESVEYIKELIDVIKALDNKGTIVISAAGNNFINNNTISTVIPAILDEVISVGATDINYNMWENSSYGYIDCVCLGQDIRVIVDKEGNTAKKTGTSLAAPLVAGLVALMKEQNKSLTRKDVMNLINKNAVDILLPGKDNRSGYGFVKAIVEVSNEIEEIEDIVKTGTAYTIDQLEKILEESSGDIVETPLYALRSKLNINDLHKKGFKGAGVKIGSTFYGGDVLKDFNIAEYIDLSGENKKVSCQNQSGNMLLSILSSKTVGLCPESDIYVYKKHLKAGNLLYSALNKDISYILKNKLDIVIYDNYLSLENANKITKAGTIIIIPSYDNSKSKGTVKEGQATEYDNTISVSYVDMNNNYITTPAFKASLASDKVDCCAYGGDFEYINSKSEIAIHNIEDYGASLFRTLFAAYQVAGIIALLKQQDPTLDVYKAKEYIKKNSIAIENATKKQVGSGLIQAKIL